MSYFRTTVAVVGVVASVASPLAAKGCSTESAKNNSSRTHTINEDNGTHEFHATGKWAWNHNYSPHGAGAACQWSLFMQKKNWKKSIRVARGTETDKVFVDKPEPGARIWLKASSCGHFVKG